MKQELMKLGGDRQTWARLGLSSIPSILSFIFNTQGNPDALYVGLYISFLLLVGSISLYVLFAKTAVPGVPTPGNDKPSHQIIDTYLVLKPFALGSSAGTLLLTILLIFVPPLNVVTTRFIFGTPTSTFTATSIPTLTSTETLIPTSTFTSTPIPTATPKEHGIYYMIVLDASLAMRGTFETESKWDAALKAVNAILEGREPEANYGLVVIGGSASQAGVNPCDQPATVTMPFTSRGTVVDNINQLQPLGGGSISKAFNLAKDQFRNLPETTVRTLIFITGSSDACESRDEWRDLQRLYEFPGGLGLELYSEIIVLENNEIISRTIKQQFDSLSANLNVQAPQTTFQLNQTNNTVITNISNYVDITIASFPTNTPTLIPTITPTRTPILYTPPVGSTTVAPPSPPTYTPSLTPTWTPSVTPSFTPLPPTATLFPEVLYITNPGNGQILDCTTGQECIIDVGIQWVPDSQSQGRYLSVWIRPIPEEPDGTGQVYHSQNSPQHQGNGIWNAPSIYIGNSDDYNGMNFAIYVIVTNEYYGAGIPQTYLPSNLSNYRVDVKRGVP